jgi:hypothetical protein
LDDRNSASSLASKDAELEVKCVTRSLEQELEGELYLSRGVVWRVATDRTYPVGAKSGVRDSKTGRVS